MALAELGQSETVRGVTEQARLVANNMTVVSEATTRLVLADQVSVTDVVELHRSLLRRASASWSAYGPELDRHLELVPPDRRFLRPPDPERVGGLVTDLIAYLNGAAHSPLIQAAVVHAQFETIHPFTDGNGRVGRALIHTVLARRGLTDRAVVPVSLVLATLRDRYIEGLTSFRHASATGSAEANAAVNRWLHTFVEATAIAVEQSETLADRIEAMRAEWGDRLTAFRRDSGLRPVPRADSAVSRLLRNLPEAPVLTAATLARILGVSHQAAFAALDELHHAGILTRRRIDRGGATAYLARDILDLVTVSERALASTQFDTRVSPPRAGAPVLPQE